jgi:hypothetical protein
MPCDAIQQFLLDADWDAGRRREVAEILRHAEQCEECQAALRDFDALRRACAPGDEPSSEPQGGWAAMDDRLAAAVRSRAEQVRQESGPAEAGGQLPLRQNPARREHLPYTWLRPILALAAAVLIAAGGFAASWLLAPRPVRIVVKPAEREPVRLTTLTPPEVSRAARKFRQVSQIGYEGRAGWMLVSGTESSVGIIPRGAPLTNKVLFLRLMLRRGSDVVSDSDLMVRAGQKADLSVPMRDGQSLRYRVGTSLNDPTHLALWLDLNSPGGSEPLAALGTNLQVEPGRMVTAGKLATSAGQYELNIEFASADEDKP